MIFKHYRFNSIQDKAEEVRQIFWKENKVPVNIDKIIEFSFNIEVRPVNGLKSQLDIEGMLSKDLTVIFVDSGMFHDSRFESRLRFTLAHELGHLILHKEFYLDAEFKSPEEWIELMNSIEPNDLSWYETHANEFAGRLLVSNKICKKFNVSPQTIETRLRREKISLTA